MKNYVHLLRRVKKLMPTNIKPCFNNSIELFLWNQKQGIIYSKTIFNNNRIMKIQRILRKSGIRELHINCSFDNYKIECEGQKIALDRAREYALKFEDNIASFIFSGKPGTGKNHLTAAIGNHLISKGKTVLVVTVADLMSNMKKTFGSNTTEASVLHELSTVDLLVIDEIGIQTESRYEKVIINQIVDRRSSSKRSTGMLSNLDMAGMSSLLGERVIDRMRIGKSLWVRFHWNSYRSRITGKE